MSQILMVQQEGPCVVAKDGYSSTVWRDEDVLHRDSFGRAVKDAVMGMVIADPRVDALETASVFNRVMFREIEGLMEKMAKRLDEIDGGDEWEKLNRLCWEPPKPKEEEIPF
jgi:hypothetical protein